MTDEKEVEYQVCKIFFLRTLGYNSDKVITVTLQSCDQGAIVPFNDRRGKNEPPNKLSPESHQLIVDHIRSFNPAVITDESMLQIGYIYLQNCPFVVYTRNLKKDIKDFN